MEPWNAIVTARGDRLPQARRVPRALGRVERTGFYNVLAMNADDPEHLIDRLERLFADPDAIVLIETIGGRADMALLTRDDCRRHPLLATH